MREQDIKFSSWVISVTSILYGLLTMSRMSDSILYGRMDGEGYHYFYYIPLILLVVCGACKIIGLTIRHKPLRRYSIVGMMFAWGFIWSSYLIDFIFIGPNRTTIILIPIISICIYIAIRGDYDAN